MQELNNFLWWDIQAILIFVVILWIFLIIAVYKVQTYKQELSLITESDRKYQELYFQIDNILLTVKTGNIKSEYDIAKQYLENNKAYFSSNIREKYIEIIDLLWSINDTNFMTVIKGVLSGKIELQKLIIQETNYTVRTFQSRKK